jgi:hypothetical protein
MSVIERHNIAGVLNESPDDKYLKVETHANGHTSLLNIYSGDRNSNTTYASAQYSIGGEILQSKVNKTALFSYNMTYCIPNINFRNGIVKFYSNSGLGSTHSVVIVENHYSVADLMTALTTALNTESGSSGLTFSTNKLWGCVYRLTSVGGGFRFLSSSHVDRAAPCTGIFITQTETTSMLLNVGAQYTNYADIVIEQLRDAQILQNSFTKDNIFPVVDHVFRIPIFQPDGLALIYIDEQIKNLNHVVIRNKQINNLTVNIYDQFGELIFSPTQTIGAQVFNIDLLTYDLKFAISA